jgi:hypothetical protein
MQALICSGFTARAPGEARARSPRFFLASGVRLPEGSWFVVVKVLAPDLRIEKPERLALCHPAESRVTSGSTLFRQVPSLSTALIRAPFP